MNNDHNNPVQQQEQPQQPAQVYQNQSQQGYPGQSQQGFPNQPQGGYPEHPYQQQQQYPQQPYQPMQYQQPPYQQYQQPQYLPPMPPQPGKGQATASLICSIFSLVVSYMGPFAIVGVILGIIAIVTSACAKKKGFIGGMATAGLTMGIIGTILSSICFITCLACLGIIGSGACAAAASDWANAEYYWDSYWDSYI